MNFPSMKFTIFDFLTILPNRLRAKLENPSWSAANNSPNEFDTKLLRRLIFRIFLSIRKWAKQSDFYF